MFLKDDEIVLRAIEMEDSQVLHKMINDPEMESMIIGWSFPVSTEMQNEWIRNLDNKDCVRYAIDVGEGIEGVAIISSIDYKNRVAHFGIKLKRDARGKGIATRAVRLMAQYCFFELNLNCIEVNVLESNLASRSLWEKVGFKPEGILRERIYKNGKYRNVIIYSLLKDEYITEK